MSRLTSILAASLLLTLACGGSPRASEGGETGESSTQSDASETSSTESSEMDEPDLPHTCEPLAQDCPDGQKCVPYVSDGGHNEPKCVPVLGDGAPGEPCTPGSTEGTDDCDASSVCWYVGESGGQLSGTCQPLCTGTTEQPSCPDGWYCLAFSGEIQICEWRCDPIAQNCPDREACYGTNTSDFLCLNAGTEPLGHLCGRYTNECALGSLCMPTCAGESCCTKVCDLELGDAQCDAVPGTVCVSLYEGQPPAGSENIGICVTP